MQLELVQFPASPPFTNEQLPTVRQTLQLQRDTLELACFLSLYARDIKSFERYMAQVKVYYNDYQSLLPASPHQGPILGLYLLCLLSQNHIADFHTEYELLCHSASASGHAQHGPVVPSSPTSATAVAQNALLSSPYIRFPIQLEQQLMEGCYNKILTAKAAVPLPLFSIFMDTLTATVRSKIADCSELAYASLPQSEVQKLLLLSSADETSKFISSRPKWTVSSGTVNFNRAQEAKVDIPALKIIQQTLEYATELERIV